MNWCTIYEFDYLRRWQLGFGADEEKQERNLKMRAQLLNKRIFI